MIALEARISDHIESRLYLLYESLDIFLVFLGQILIGTQGSRSFGFDESSSEQFIQKL